MTQNETTIAEAADRLSKELPGHRVEILQGRLTVTPLADGRHARTLTRLVVAFHRAGATEAGLEFLQGIGLWLPAGPDDYAIADFSLVEAVSGGRPVSPAAPTTPATNISWTTRGR
ncbi:hypothetical protein [Streptomyces nojiriensis]|uniref:hypothetical protein n=1 Tax=Streptomyces nojiriensis TaxID=66374 RepID=UPI003685D52F